MLKVIPIEKRAYKRISWDKKQAILFHLIMFPVVNDVTRARLYPGIHTIHKCYRIHISVNIYIYIITTGFMMQSPFPPYYTIK